MSSPLFISFALILSVQFAASQDILGTWSNPMTTYDSDLYCCVPTSITIEAMEGTNNMKATYQFPSIFQQGYNAKCGSFFNGNVNGQAATTVFKDTSSGQYFISKYDFYGNKNYVFSVSGGSLSVQGAGTSSSTTCKFSMNTKASGSSGGTIGFLVLVAAIVGFVAFKNYQKKQQSALAQQNIPENDVTISNPNPTYVAPQQYAYAQPQMNVNVNMNQNPQGNVAANGGVAIHVGVNH